MSFEGFDEFSYPGLDHPSGVVERGLADEVVDLIDASAAMVCRDLGARRMDCLFAAKAWHDTLRGLGGTVDLLTGWGQHTDTIPPTPRELIGGYYTDDDGIVRHWWLVVGVKQLIFDPTAHQFDSRGGVAIFRYRNGGQSLVDWRDANKVFVDD